jgi:hypothetical protein
LAPRGLVSIISLLPSGLLGGLRHCLAPPQISKDAEQRRWSTMSTQLAQSQLQFPTMPASNTRRCCENRSAQDRCTIVFSLSLVQPCFTSAARKPNWNRVQDHGVNEQRQQGSSQRPCVAWQLSPAVLSLHLRRFAPPRASLFSQRPNKVSTSSSCQPCRRNYIATILQG